MPRKSQRQLKHTKAPLTPVYHPVGSPEWIRQKNLEIAKRSLEKQENKRKDDIRNWQNRVSEKAAATVGKQSCAKR